MNGNNETLTIALLLFVEMSFYFSLILVKQASFISVLLTCEDKDSRHRNPRTVKIHQTLPTEVCSQIPLDWFLLINIKTKLETH